MASAQKMMDILFQFKHCTIISAIATGKSNLFNISIQALYDYKLWEIKERNLSGKISIQALYDYKSVRNRHKTKLEFISIQALYDYKYQGQHPCRLLPEFQFKHCTIISSSVVLIRNCLRSFQFKHCTIIRSSHPPDSWSVHLHFNSSIVRL